ncbi:MAG: right-handed parallel beta-helix repeat-containing protein [Candidatus Hydrogenedentes bacterium]|nr:right-handed parallel beta-helix repeat-containing protein [Candidatus Hydrogenedentota bacterium]
MMTMTRFSCIVILLFQGFNVYGGSALRNASAGRNYPENELLARPALRITVGQRDADIVGADNRALQAAVDYVGQFGGGVVEVGPGEYLMHDSLHMRSGVTLRGAGKATVLKKSEEVRSLLAADGDFGECAITVQNPEGFEIGRGVHIATKRVHGFHTICATILNKQDNYLTLSRPLNADCMMVDEANAATIFPVISAYHVEDFRVENITIDGNRDRNSRINGCRGAGIFFYQGDAGIVENCTVRDYSGDGISFQQSNDVQVLNCIVENCAGGGIHPGSGSQRAVVRSCKARHNDADGFFFCWRVRHAVVEDNEFCNNGATGISIGHKDTDNLIRRNLIAGNAKGGVHWRDETEPMAAHNITFTENAVRNNGPFGLHIEGATQGTVIRNNTIECDDPECVGVRIGEKTADAVIKENEINAAQKILDNRVHSERESKI